MTGRVAHLLVTDRRALDLEGVRRAASARGWEVELQRLDGRAAPADDAAWFPEILRLRVTAAPGEPAPDARALVSASAGLALDELRAHPRPPAD